MNERWYVVPDWVARRASTPVVVVEEDREAEETLMVLWRGVPKEGSDSANKQGR